PGGPAGWLPLRARPHPPPAPADPVAAARRSAPAAAAAAAAPGLRRRRPGPRLATAADRGQPHPLAARLARPVGRAAVLRRLDQRPPLAGVVRPHRAPVR